MVIAKRGSLDPRAVQGLIVPKTFGGKVKLTPEGITHINKNRDDVIAEMFSLLIGRARAKGYNFLRRKFCVYDKERQEVNLAIMVHKPATITKAQRQELE